MNFILKDAGLTNRQQSIIRVEDLGMAARLCDRIHAGRTFRLWEHPIWKKARFLSKETSHPVVNIVVSDASTRKKEYVNERGRSFVDLRRVLVRGGGLLENFVDSN